MCQSVTGPSVVLEERTAYKVVISDTAILLPSGPLYSTTFIGSGWSKSVTPRQYLKFTHYGYHVFNTEKGAKDYLQSSYFADGCKVIKVRIKGKAIPFSAGRYKGYAVQYWKPIK